MIVQNLNIKLRRAEPEDLLELQTLFVETIRCTCINDYSREQINAWTASVENKQQWINKIKNQFFLIAEIDGKIVGFGSLGNGNYLDLLYVHKDYLRKGIAEKIYGELANESKRLGFKKITSDVSITAKPFFEKKGFKIEKENKLLIKGIEIINYRMIKQ